MKYSLLITIIIFFTQFYNQNQWNILRITKGIYNKLDKINENAYIFHLYTPDRKYEFSSGEEFLLKGTDLPDYSKFNLAHKSSYIFNSELEDFHLKLQFMGGSNTNNKYFENEFFKKKLTKILDKSNQEIFVEDYFIVFFHTSVFNNSLYWDCKLFMYEENSYIKIDFLTILKNKYSQDFDLFYVNPKIEKENFIFNLKNLNNKTARDKKIVIPLYNPKVKKVFFNFLVLAKGGLFNYRFKGYFENQEDMNKFKNYLGAFEERKVVLFGNKFNYISGFFLQGLGIKRGIYTSLFKFNTIYKNGKINFKIQSNHNLQNYKGGLNYECNSDNNDNLENLLNNSENTNFKIEMKTKNDGGKLSFKFYENVYANINTKMNAEFELNDFMVEQIFPEDLIKCKLSYEEGENLLVKIDILIKEKNDIQSKLQIKFNENNLEANLIDMFFKGAENIYQNCEIRNPEEYEKIKTQKIVIKGDNFEQEFENDTEIEKSKKVFEMGVHFAEQQVKRCFLFITNKKKYSYLQISVEEKLNIKNYPKIILDSNENKFKLLLSNTSIHECDLLDEFDLNELLKKKLFYIKTQVQHDLKNFEFEDFWRSSENEGNFYMNLQNNKDNSLDLAIKRIFDDKKKCFVKFNNSDIIEINIFSSSTVSLEFTTSDIDQDFYSTAILLNKGNQQILKTTDINLQKSNLTMDLYKKFFNFYILEEENQIVHPFILLRGGLDKYIISMSSDLSTPKKLMIFDNIFKNPNNMLLSFEDLKQKKTLKITIYKDSMINPKNLNTGIYSLNSLELIGKSTYFLTKFNYKSSENSISCKTEIVKEFRYENLSKDNRFVFEKNKEIDEEEGFIKNEQFFIPLEVSATKPNIKIKRYTINKKYENQFDFSNIYYTKDNERLLFLCIYPDQSRLNLNLYDLEFEENNKIVFYQNYSYKVLMFSEKKSMAMENIVDSNINIKFEFKETRELQFNFNRNLSEVKCEYINVTDFADNKFFEPKIDVKKDSSSGHGIDVNITLIEKMRKILV